ncbi:MucBP domain-containing protein, partial [Vagococcus elongatus]
IRTGKVGDNYLSTKREYKDYELVEIPANARGQFIDGEIVVTYVYKKIETEPEIKWGKVIVKYVDESGKELAESEELTEKVGIVYETKAKAIDGYELVDTPVNATGTYTEEEIVVTYVYKKAATPIDKEEPKKDSKDKLTVSKKVLPKTGENTTSISIKIIGMILLFVGVSGVIIKKIRGKNISFKN